MIYKCKAKPPRLRGFTLIELVVVIAIILLLLGLTLSAGLAIRKQSEVRETENILRLLDTAMQEWQRIAERPLSWGEDDTPIIGIRYDLQGKIGAFPLTPEILVITELLGVINRPDQVNNIIAQIEKQQSAWIEIPDPPKGKSLFIKEWDYNTVFISHISNKSIPTSPKEKT